MAVAAHTLWDAPLRPPALGPQPPDEAGAAGSWALLERARIHRRPPQRNHRARPDEYGSCATVPI
jgi:hypothetical protein